MSLTPLKLLTVIADEALEKRLVADILKLGAHGYSVHTVQGQGAHGPRNSEWEGENRKIMVLVGSELAERILAYLAEHYFEQYPIIAYLTPAEVWRGSKYL